MSEATLRSGGDEMWNPTRQSRRQASVLTSSHDCGVVRMKCDGIEVVSDGSMRCVLDAAVVSIGERGGRTGKKWEWGKARFINVEKARGGEGRRPWRDDSGFDTPKISGQRSELS